MKKTLALLVLAALCTTGVAFAGDSKDTSAPVHKESTEMVKKHKAPKHKAAKHKASLKTEGAVKETAPAK